jgi:hypothetical protein
LVEERVGLREERRRVALAGAHGDTEARGHGDPGSLVDEACRRELRAQALGRSPGRLEWRIGQDDHELLAAVARDPVDALAHLGTQHRGNALEHGVAPGVAELVVHALEVVDVGHDHRERLAGPAAAQRFLG